MVSKEEYWKNPEKYRAKANEYRLSHPEWKKKSDREWMAKKRAANPAYVRRESEQFKIYRKKNQKRLQASTLAWAHRNPGVYLFHNAKGRAKKLGLAFDIDRTDIVIPETCPVLGIPINATVRGRRGFHPNSPSIDRIIPELGYVRHNVKVISNLANILKRTEANPENLRLVADYIERERKRIGEMTDAAVKIQTSSMVAQGMRR